LKNSKTLKVGFVCLLVAIIVGAILWYFYFGDTEHEVLAKNVRLELINNGRVNYIDAIPDDLDEAIPTYYFRVKNNVDVPVVYDILINDVSANDANDGCTQETLFTREQLDYELYKDNKIIKKGTLSDLTNDIILNDSMDKGKTTDYAIRIRLNEKARETLGKHYHYVVNFREIK